MMRSQFLQDLITRLSPTLDSIPYVYCTVANATYGELEKLKSIVSIAELEGLTLVIPLEQAKAEGLTITESSVASPSRATQVLKLWASHPW